LGLDFDLDLDSNQIKWVEKQYKTLSSVVMDRKNELWGINQLSQAPPRISQPIQGQPTQDVRFQTPVNQYTTINQWDQVLPSTSHPNQPSQQAPQAPLHQAPQPLFGQAPQAPFNQAPQAPFSQAFQAPENHHFTNKQYRLGGPSFSHDLRNGFHEYQHARIDRTPVQYASIDCTPIRHLSINSPSTERIPIERVEHAVPKSWW
jgi:hypothetical protein